MRTDGTTSPVQGAAATAPKSGSPGPVSEHRASTQNSPTAVLEGLTNPDRTPKDRQPARRVRFASLPPVVRSNAPARFSVAGPSVPRTVAEATSEGPSADPASVIAFIQQARRMLGRDINDKTALDTAWANYKFARNNPPAPNASAFGHIEGLFEEEGDSALQPVVRDSENPVGPHDAAETVDFEFFERLFAQEGGTTSQSSVAGPSAGFTAGGSHDPGVHRADVIAFVSRARKTLGAKLNNKDVLDKAWAEFRSEQRTANRPTLIPEFVDYMRAQYGSRMSQKTLLDSEWAKFRGETETPRNPSGNPSV